MSYAPLVDGHAPTFPAPSILQRSLSLSVGALFLSSIGLMAFGAGVSAIISDASSSSSSSSTGGGGGGIPPLPVVISTWFPQAVSRGYSLLADGFTAMDAVELSCTLCEDEQCDGTVGWGGSPDTSGETTLDALIMDAETHAVGAVTSLRRVKHAISAARKVMLYTQHTLLAGDGATNFSHQMGLPEEDLHSQRSIWQYGNWCVRVMEMGAVIVRASARGHSSRGGPTRSARVPGCPPVGRSTPGRAVR